MMEILEIMSRVGLLLTSVLVLALLVYIRRSGRGYGTGPLIALSAVYIVFYVFSLLYRVGAFHPPTQYFFSTFSNFRTWATSVVALVLLAPMARDIWIGRRS